MAAENLTTALDELTSELRAVREQLRRERLWRLATLAALALVVALGIIGWVDQRGEQARIRHAVSVDCPGIRDFATFDLPPSAGELARRIVRNYRASYEGRCVDILGPLPPADPDATLPAPIPTSTPTPTAAPVTRPASAGRVGGQ